MICTGTGYRVIEPIKTWNKLKKIISGLKINPSLVDKYELFGSFICYSTVKTYPGLKCAGKGLSPIDAKVGSVMELIERISRIDLDVNKIIIGNYNNLSLKTLIIPHVYCYICKDKSDSCEDNYLKRCNQWVKAYSLISNKELLIPKEAVSLDTNLKILECTPQRLSTGLAAGNTYEEAIIHGLFEVVE